MNKLDFSQLNDNPLEQFIKKTKPTVKQKMYSIPKPAIPNLKKQIINKE